MKEKIKVIVKRPGEQSHTETINNTLEAFQEIVGGYIETYPCGPAVIICNEEGRNLGLMHNFICRSMGWPELIVGPVVVCGTDGEDMDDCPFDLTAWNQMLTDWRAFT